MEHTPEHRIDKERDMHPDYLAKESSFREKAASLWKREEETRARIRADVDLDEEQRASEYTAARRQLESDFEKLTNEIGRDVGRDIAQATQTLYAGQGADFAQHLSTVAGVPDERLEELYNTATRSGQDALARAIGATAYERGNRALFAKWAAADPARAQALERLRKTPGSLQFYDRTTKAMQVSRASINDLLPRKEDIEKAREARAAKERERRAALAGPRTRSDGFGNTFSSARR